VRYQYAYYVPFAAGVAWVFARRLPMAAAVAILAAGLINTVMVDSTSKVGKALIRRQSCAARGSITTDSDRRRFRQFQ
jgi:uncharacterized protein (DUF2062 family)